MHILATLTRSSSIFIFVVLTLTCISVAFEQGDEDTSKMWPQIPFAHEDKGMVTELHSLSALFMKMTL